MAVPMKDSVLVPWSTNFNTRAVASPTTFGLTTSLMALYTPLHEDFVDAYNALQEARQDGTYARSQTAIKEAAKNALREYACELYSLVLGQPTSVVSDADKILLGIKLRATPAPVPPPTDRPGMDLVSVNGRTVEVHIHDSASSSKRGKPAGAKAAVVYSWVGEEYPADPALWNYEGATTKPKFRIVFSPETPAGTPVWICAAWANAKCEAGPTCLPITANIQGGGSTASAMKIAA